MTLPNEASVGLHRALGFEPVGTYRRIGWKHGAWHDVAWVQRSLGPDGDAGPTRLIARPHKYFTAKESGARVAAGEPRPRRPRVVIALGGNAMTGPDGSATPGRSGTRSPRPPGTSPTSSPPGSRWC